MYQIFRFYYFILVPRIPTSLTTAMAPPIPGTDAEQPSQTVGWKLNHICFRIRDPVATTRFYRDILGMRTIFTVDAGSFSILYFGYPEVVGEHETGQEMIERRHNREGLIEFIHLKVPRSHSAAFFLCLALEANAKGRT